MRIFCSCAEIKYLTKKAALILIFLEAAEIIPFDAGFFHASKRKAIGRVTVIIQHFNGLLKMSGRIVDVSAAACLVR